MRRVFKASLLAALALAVPSVGLTRESLLARALSCGIDPVAIPRLLSTLAAEDAGMASAARSFGAPSGNLYRLTAPVGALGYSSDSIYVAPGRIVMVVFGQTPSAVSARLKLESDSHGPAERRIDDARKLIAYELHQEGLSGATLVGCEYADPAAASWLAGNMAGF